MSGHCNFCDIWHSGPCCHPGRDALDLAQSVSAGARDRLAEAERVLRLYADATAPITGEFARGYFGREG